MTVMVDQRIAVLNKNVCLLMYACNTIISHF